MRILLTCISILSFLLLMTIPANAAVSPVSDNGIIPSEILYKKIVSLKVKDIQRLAGRKLTLKEKVSFFLLKQKLKHKKNDASKQGQTAFIIGLIALGLLALGFFVPYALVGALVASILAIVFGSMAKKRDPSDKKAQAGKLLGWISLGIFGLLIIIGAIIIASWDWF